MDSLEVMSNAVLEFIGMAVFWTAIVVWVTVLVDRKERREDGKTKDKDSTSRRTRLR